VGGWAAWAMSISMDCCSDLTPTELQSQCKSKQSDNNLRDNRRFIGRDNEIENFLNARFDPPRKKLHRINGPGRSSLHLAQAQRVDMEWPSI
jgi:hypothetical protein